MNCNLFVVPETKLYDLETPPVVGCCITPFNDTSKLSLFGTFCERLYNVVLPSPV